VPRLEVADDQAWLASLGVLPQTEEATGAEYVRELRIPVNDSEEVQITWYDPDCSVRVRHHKGSGIVSDLYREMATLLTVVGTGSAGEVIIEYGSSGWSGRARIQVLPDVLIKDTVLRA